MKMSKGKFDGIQAVANENGIITAAAMDQRGSLRKSIAKAKGSDVSDAELTEFKSLVTEVLTPYASAILMDPEYGLKALDHRASGTGVLLAYEKTGYDVSVKGRLPDLLPGWSVEKLAQAGANAIKILLYYNPEDSSEINSVKHEFVRRVGEECRVQDVPLFLEPLCYSDEIGDEKSLEFAKVKPQMVKAYMQEFSKPEYGVDILKVEVPVNARFVEGMTANEGHEVAYTRDEAKQYFKDAAAVAGLPFIYLSAGVTADIFRETIELAVEAEVPFSGVLCGRATWQDGVAVYGQQGAEALRAWLLDQGVKNIEALNEVLYKGARPWWEFYGGRENIQLV